MENLSNFFIKATFIKEELKKANKYYYFSNEIDRAYSETYKWLTILPELCEKNIDTFPTTLNNHLKNKDDEVNSAREFTSLLPSHTLKMYDLFLRMENSSNNNGEYFVLDKPLLSFIDIGCGGGSASIAVIMLLLNFQKHRLNLNLPIYPIKVHLLGIDPNDFVLKIYSKFISAIAEKLHDLLIEISCNFFPGTFNMLSNQIISWLEKKERIDNCIFAFGNVIRPQIAELNKQKTRVNGFDRFNKAFIPKYYGQAIEDTAAIGSILRCDWIDKVSIAIVASRTGEKDWSEEIKLFSSQIKGNQQIKAHKIKAPGIRKREINILGPKDCLFRRVRNHDQPFKDVFLSGFIQITKNQFLEDKDWQRVLSLENLLLAWVRVRNSLSEIQLDDTIEVRLFDIDVINNLERMRCKLLSYDWGTLATDDLLNYFLPKGEQRPPRPLSICRMEEQIFATALLQARKTEYEDVISVRSFAYRLNDKKSGENLYRHWFTCYKNFIEKAEEVARAHPSYSVLKTDISSYYPSINQKKLYNRIENLFHLYSSDRLSGLTKHLIARDCGVGNQDLGIPQTHIASGAFSNIYLVPVDQFFNSQLNAEIHYFRFVDDMIFIFPPEIAPETILDMLDKKLEDLSLTRSEKKTSEVLTIDEFICLIAPDSVIDRLSKSFISLLSDLYKLRKSYAILLRLDWWRFIDNYQNLLFSIGIFIDKPRLSRKLRKYHRWWSVFTIRPTIFFPDIRGIDDLENIEQWNGDFIKENEWIAFNWIERRKQLLDELKAFFVDALYQIRIQKNELDVAIAKRRFKFSVDRLGKLGYEELTDTVIELLVDTPWVFNVRRVCDDLVLQGKEKDLIKALRRLLLKEENEWGSIRANTIKAFSKSRSLSIESLNLLENIAFNGKTEIERLAASEVLFIYQNRLGITKSQIQRKIISRKEHLSIAKNYVLLYPFSKGKVEKMKFRYRYHELINKVIQLSHVEENLQTLLREEPDILRRSFYESEYPDDGREFPDFPSNVY